MRSRAAQKHTDSTDLYPQHCFVEYYTKYWAFNIVFIRFFGIIAKKFGKSNICLLLNFYIYLFYRQKTRAGPTAAAAASNGPVQVTDIGHFVGPIVLFADIFSLTRYRSHATSGLVDKVLKQ
jgi:hypothetical protein